MLHEKSRHRTTEFFLYTLVTHVDVSKMNPFSTDDRMRWKKEAGFNALNVTSSISTLSAIYS